MTVDAQILLALRTAEPLAVSGTELARQLGISRAAVWARIEELRILGYDIAASPHQGYCLRNVPDVLHADDLLSLVAGTRVIGRDIRVFEKTRSTNDVAEKLARDGAPEGVVVLAESQTHGRGRLGRTWISPARKGLWFSLLLRPSLRPEAATQLTVATGNALARGLRQFAGVNAQIKWPNDVLIRGRKVAGILTELSAELDRIKYTIIGIGIDVNLATGDLPANLRSVATSLKIETGRHFRRADLAAAILKELDADYARIGRDEFAQLANEWAAQCTTLGERVRIQIGDRLVYGRAESLDDTGALLLRTAHGRLERVLGGDVSVERPGE